MACRNLTLENLSYNLSHWHITIDNGKHSGKNSILVQIFFQTLIFIYYCKMKGRMKVKMKVTQSCPTLQPCGLYSPWNSSGQNTGVGNHSLFQEPSQLRDRTQVSHIAGRSFTSWATSGAPKGKMLLSNRMRFSRMNDDDKNKKEQEKRGQKEKNMNKNLASIYDFLICIRLCSEYVTCISSLTLTMAQMRCLLLFSLIYRW